MLRENHKINQYVSTAQHIYWLLQPVLWLIANHVPCSDPVGYPARNHTAKDRIKSRIVPRVVFYGKRGSQAGFSPRIFGFTLSIFTSPLLNNCLSECLVLWNL